MSDSTFNSNGQGDGRNPHTPRVVIVGDMALMRGVAKAVLEAADKDPSVLDREFIKYHTHGFAEYRALVVSTAWADIVRGSGISEADIRKLADTYIASKRVIIAWCLGITQHEHGVDTVREIVNLLLPAGKHRTRGSGTVPDPRTQQRAGQPNLRN